MTDPHPSVPEELAALLRTRPRVGDRLQAFSLVTTDPDGRPQVALLSTAEVEVDESRTALRLAVAGRRASAALRRRAPALFLGVTGADAHHVTLAPRHLLDVEGLLAVHADVVGYERDTVGVALDPLTYVVTEALTVQERWDRSARALDALAAAVRGGGTAQR